MSRSKQHHCKFLTNAFGFSLTELMVTVAIIAVLGAIAAPAYRNYQARARRVEGLNLLTGYYPPAQAARAEFGFYPGNMVETDYKIVGQIGYRFRTNDNAARVAPIALTDAGCINTNQDAASGACDCGGACAGWREFVEKRPMGALGAEIGPQTVVTACPPLADLSVTDNAFSVRTGGVISLSSNNIDRLGMDELKQIQVCSDGTK